MNLWDSVHRSLEKASSSAGRIAKIQRTRSQIEKLGRQITVQEQDVLKKAVELYAAGMLTQPELLTPCQDLFNSHQQLSQARHELEILQSQGPVDLPPGTQGTTYAPPPSYPSANADTTAPIIPPPPPGMAPLTIHSQETMIMEEEAAQVAPNTDKVDLAAAPTQFDEAPVQVQQCPGCGKAIQADNLYCPTCGRALHPHLAEHLPTARVISSSSAHPGLLPGQLEDQATVLGENPPPATDTGLPEKDRG